MKTAILFFLSAAMAVGQTAKPAPKQEKPPVVTSATFNACDRDGDEYCISVIGTTTDPHGCRKWSGPFEWDEGSQTCRTSVTIAKQPAPVTCSPMSAPDSDGSQHMVCWYTPVPDSKGAAK